MIKSAAFGTVRELSELRKTLYLATIRVDLLNSKLGNRMTTVAESIDNAISIVEYHMCDATNTLIKRLEMEKYFEE